MNKLKDKVMWCIGYDRMCDTYQLPSPRKHGWVIIDGEIGVVDHPYVNRGLWGEDWKPKQTVVLIPSVSYIQDILKSSDRFKGVFHKQGNRIVKDHEDVTLICTGYKYWEEKITGIRIDELLVHHNCVGDLSYALSRLNKDGIVGEI